MWRSACSHQQTTRYGCFVVIWAKVWGRNTEKQTKEMSWNTLIHWLSPFELEFCTKTKSTRVSAKNIMLTSLQKVKWHLLEEYNIHICTYGYMCRVLCMRDWTPPSPCEPGRLLCIHNTYLISLTSLPQLQGEKVQTPHRVSSHTFCSTLARWFQYGMCIKVLL